MRIQFYYFSTRKWLCKVCSLALFCGFVAAASAELTQADITAAINAAIIVPKVNNNGQIFQTALYRGSSSIASLQYQTNIELGRFKQAVLGALAALTNAPASSGATSAWTTNDVAALRETLAAVQQAITGFNYPDINSAVWDINNRLYYWDDVVFRGWSDEFFDHVHFTGDEELLVHDPSTENAVSALQGAVIDKLSDIIQNMSDNNASVVSAIQNMPTVDLSTLESDTAVLRAQSLAERNADDTVESVSSSAESDAEIEYQHTEEEQTSEYEDIPLPKAESSYTPTLSEDTLPSDPFDLSSTDRNLQHNSLVVLSRGGSGSMIPTMEWDIGRDADLVGFIDKVGGLAAWLYGILFGVLGTYKGLRMYGVIRTASVSSATGMDPMIHLAFDPF